MQRPWNRSDYDGWRTMERSVCWSGETGGDRCEESGEGRQLRVDRPWESWVLFSALREFIATLSRRAVRSHLCFQIAVAAGGNRCCWGEGITEVQEYRVEVKRGMRS